MADMFGNNAVYGKTGIVHSENVMMSVSQGVNNNLGTYLVQSIVLRYGRPIQYISEIGSSTSYGYAGTPQGTLSVTKFIGEKTLSDVFGPPGTGIWKVPSGPNDQPGTIVIKDKDGNIKYTLQGCVVTSISPSISATGGPIGESAEIIFGSCSNS